MINKLSGWKDTIVAPATAPGVGAISVIRVSGDKTLEIIDALFPSKKISEQATHTLHVGMLKDGERPIDEVVLSVFRGPKSYTGEDTIEISCHGSAFIQKEIINACVARGARPARAGEFTQRAFLNGKMDLTQAEAVADIIAADTEASQKAALHNIRGGFSHELSHLREQLISFSALIELELDFATEDVEFADRAKFNELVDSLSAAVKRLIESFALGNVIKNGVSVAIIGKPNAGKSTLLNALLNEDRAIVSEIAGTTRDTIEEVINIKGILFRLIDTAGIHAGKGDLIEDIGMERARANAINADIVIHLKDMTDYNAVYEEWLNSFAEKTITVNNKFDAWHEQLNKEGLVVDLAAGIYISAKSGEGIDNLKQILFDKAAGDTNPEGNIVTNTRHLESLKKISASLDAIKAGLQNNITGDLLSSDIRTALYHLGDITGEVTNEKKLDFIFSKFCIGK